MVNTKQALEQQPTEAEEAQWFAIYTRYKSEKLVTKTLQQKGIEAYIPIQKLVRRYTRKVKHVELPLISCYVFVKITQLEEAKVLQTDNVLNFIKFSGKMIPIPEIEISILKRVVGEEIPVEAKPGTRGELTAGDWVEINSGNLIGLKGRLVEVENKNKLIVQLENVGYTLHLEVKPSQVSRLPNYKTQ